VSLVFEAASFTSWAPIFSNGSGRSISISFWQEDSIQKPEARSQKVGEPQNPRTSEPRNPGTSEPRSPTVLVGAINLAQSIRLYGHLAAQIDPLGSRPVGDPLLLAEAHGVTESDLRALPAGLIGGPVAGDRSGCSRA